MLGVTERRQGSLRLLYHDVSAVTCHYISKTAWHGNTGRLGRSVHETAGSSYLHVAILHFLGLWLALASCRSGRRRLCPPIAQGNTCMITEVIFTQMLCGSCLVI